MFKHMFRNFLRCFSGYNLLWQLAAVALTYGIVAADFDWKYFEATRSVWLMRAGFLAAIAGFFLPYLIPFFLYFHGKTARRRTLIIAAYAIGQAELLGWIITSIYKAFTGRMPPVVHAKAAELLVDTSRQFHFGFWRDGIFWGWPSSHTTVAFAMAFTVIALYTSRKVRIPALLYAFFIGLGVSVTIHWFSEFVAGAIIGAVIGTTVGRDFKRMR